MKQGIGVLAALLAFAHIGNAYGQNEPIRVSVGGKLRHFFFVSDQDEIAPEAINAFGMSSDVEIYFKGSTKLDNGLEISAVVELEAETSGSTNGDEVYIDIRGDWGRFRIGEKEGFNASFNGSPVPEAFLTTDERIIGEMAIKRRNGVTVNDTFTFKRFASDVLGVRYETPSFSGFKAAVSYHPSVATGEGPTDMATQRNNAIDVSAGWTGRVGAVDLRVGGGYFHVSSRKSQFLADDGIEAWNANVTATMGRVQIGGTIMDVNPVNGTDETSWTVGALYNLQPWSFSADYFHAVRKPFANATIKERTEFVKLQSAYKLGPGIGVGLTGFYTTQRDATNVSYDGYGMIMGAKLDF